VSNIVDRYVQSPVAQQQLGLHHY